MDQITGHERRLARLPAVGTAGTAHGLAVEKGGSRVWAFPGVPRETLQALSDAVERAVRSPEVSQKLVDRGVEYRTGVI